MKVNQKWTYFINNFYYFINTLIKININSILFLFNFTMSEMDVFTYKKAFKGKREFKMNYKNNF